MNRMLLLPLVLLPAVAEAQGITSPYLQIVWRYRAGDTRGAVVAAAELPTGGLRDRVLRDLGSNACRALAGSPDCEELRERQPLVYRARVAPILRAAIPAAALLHLHTSMSLDFIGEPEKARAHRLLMRILIDRMSPVEAALEAPDAARFREIRRRIQLLHTWLLQSDISVDEVDEDVRDALRAFPDDADLLLASGWVEETRARPMFLEQRYAIRQTQMSTASGRRAWIDREHAFRLARAAELYRRCLTLQPTKVEARVRLGRVQFLQGRLDEARATLAVIGPRDEPRVRYLAALFAAAVEEGGGSAVQARRWYSAAIGMWPTSQVARISLARLTAREGDRAAAAALVATLSPAPGALDATGDPWSWYQMGQAWRLESAFVAVRADLHQ